MQTRAIGQVNWPKCIADRQRPSEQMALRHPAACGEHRFGLRAGLDALRDDLHTQRVAQPDDGPVQRADPVSLRPTPSLDAAWRIHVQ